MADFTFQALMAQSHHKGYTAFFENAEDLGAIIGGPSTGNARQACGNGMLSIDS